MDEARTPILTGTTARIIDDITRAEAAEDLVCMTTALRLPAKLLRPGGRPPKAYSLSMATALEKRKTVREDKRIVKDNVDVMQSLSVPINSVRTDRLKVLDILCPA